MQEASNLTTPALVETVTSDLTATPRELALADRLAAAINEIEALTADIARLEARCGTDT